MQIQRHHKPPATSREITLGPETLQNKNTNTKLEGRAITNANTPPATSREITLGAETSKS